MGKTYKFTGSKGDNVNTELVDMGDGRVAAVGQTIELSDAEVETLKESGVKLTEAKNEDSKNDESTDESENVAVADSAPDFSKSDRR